jgi:hypothetical protein
VPELGGYLVDLIETRTLGARVIFERYRRARGSV